MFKKIIFSILLIMRSVFATNLGLIGDQFIFSGPNCHNTALRAAGAMSTRRYIREDEMRKILSNRCRLVSKAVDSIGVIHVGPDDNPMHAFVLLEDDHVLTKNGVSKREGVLEQSYDEMMYIHKRAIEKNCKIKKIPEAECLIKINYYNCDPILSLKIEELLDKAYDERETIFKSDYQNLISEALENTLPEQLECPRYKSIFQSLEIMNWNSMGPIEYESMNLFIKSIKDKFKSKFCPENL